MGEILGENQPIMQNKISSIPITRAVEESSVTKHPMQEGGRFMAR